MESILAFKIEPLQLESHGMKVNALFFRPEVPSDKIAVFSPGYTSHKASLLNWSTALMDKNISSLIFDLPGHFLGGHHPVPSFEIFAKHSPELFRLAVENIGTLLGKDSSELDCTIGGHSLGALLALQALQEHAFPCRSINAVCVGLGIYPPGKTHVYATKLFEKTIAIRNGYVDPCLHSNIMFPWIGNSKQELKISKARVHLICGQDDLVVGGDGLNRLSDKLKELGNEVSCEQPLKLAHHLPELATKFVINFISS
jgi:hypothetical protein